MLFGEIVANLSFAIVEADSHVGQIHLHQQLTSNQHTQISTISLNPLSINIHASTITTNAIVSSLLAITRFIWLLALGDYPKVDTTTFY